MRLQWLLLVLLVILVTDVFGDKLVSLKMNIMYMISCEIELEAPTFLRSTSQFSYYIVLILF
jgi:hypothetical protein